MKISMTHIFPIYKIANLNYIQNHSLILTRGIHGEVVFSNQQDLDWEGFRQKSLKNPSIQGKVYSGEDFKIWTRSEEDEAPTISTLNQKHIFIAFTQFGT